MCVIRLWGVSFEGIIIRTKNSIYFQSNCHSASDGDGPSLFDVV